MTKRDIRKLIKKVRTPFKGNYFVEADVIDIAHRLNLTLKTSAKCLEDFGVSDFPLNADTKSILAETHGEPTIYYDEKNTYKNFLIATMIVAYLCWCYKHEVPEQSLMNYGAITMIVPKFALKNCTLSDTEFSNRYNIPPKVVVEYFNARREALRENKSYN